MKQIILFAGMLCFATLSLEAQSLSYSEDAEMRRELEKILNGGERADGCSETFLIIPPFIGDPTKKLDLPLGVDLKPLLESYISQGTKKFLLSGVGDAIGCDAFCASQALTDWHLRGQLFGWNIVWGRLDTITAKQPGKYIVVGYTQEGCAVVEAFVVACPPTGGNVRDTVEVEKIIYKDSIVLITEKIVVYLEQSTTGTSEEGDQRIKFFPNPFVEILNVDIPDLNNRNLQLVITNEGGIYIQTITSLQSSNQVGQNLSSGMYILTIKGEGIKPQSFKVIKQ